MAKSKPHTIRFEEEDFNFICKRETLSTAQGIVSFLMDNYIKLYKVEKRSIFLVDKPKEYDSPPLPKYVQDEPAMYQEVAKDYGYYELRGKKVEFDKAEELIREIFADAHLKQWQKTMLQKMINERFFNN